MKRAALLVLLLATTTAAGRMIVSFRLKKDPHAPVRAWALHADEEGFAVSRVGRERRFKVRWDDIVDADRERIRKRFGLERSEEDRLGLVSGHRLHLVGGGRADGLLERVDADGRHWLRREGVLLPYPADRIARVEELRLRDTEIYDADGLYARRMERTPPRTASQHRELATRLLAQGSLEKAARHFREALKLRPGWHAQIRERLTEIDALAADAVAARLLAKARSAYRLRKDFDGAARQLRAFAAAHPDRARLAARILDDLEAERVAAMRKRFTAVKNEEFARVVERYLRTTKPDLEEALAWMRARAEAETRAAVAKRLGLTAEQVETFLEDEPVGATRWCTYGGGSFIFSRRAEKGKTTKKAIRGDPDAWWYRYDDVETRSTFLRAYGAERLPRLFEVVQVRLRECGRCGGTGAIRHVSVNQLADSRHEWKQVCPRCFRACLDRSVGYR